MFSQDVFILGDTWPCLVVQFLGWGSAVPLRTHSAGSHWGWHYLGGHAGGTWGIMQFWGLNSGPYVCDGCTFLVYLLGP